MNTFLNSLWLVFILMVPLFGWRSWVSELKCWLQILIIAVLAIKLNTLFGENDLLLLLFLTSIAFRIDRDLSLAVTGCWHIHFLILYLDIGYFDLLMLLMFFFEVLIELVAWVDNEWEDNHQWTFGVHCKKHVAWAVS